MRVDRFVVVVEQNNYKLITNVEKIECGTKRLKVEKIPPAPASNLKSLCVLEKGCICTPYRLPSPFVSTSV